MLGLERAWWKFMDLPFDLGLCKGEHVWHEWAQKCEFNCLKFQGLIIKGIILW